MFFLAGLLYRYAPLVRESMGCSGGCREAGALIRRSTSGAAYAFTPALRPQSERLLTYTTLPIGLYVPGPRHPTYAQHFPSTFAGHGLSVELLDLIPTNEHERAQERRSWLWPS